MKVMFVTRLFDLAALNDQVHKANCHKKLLLSKIREKIADSNLTIQFLHAVFTQMEISVKIDVRFFF